MLSCKGRNKNGSKGQHGNKGQSKGPGFSKPSGLWGIRHIWAFCLSLAAYCNGILQVRLKSQLRCSLHIQSMLAY